MSEQPDPSQQPEDPAGLRKKLEDALTREKEKDAEVKTLKATNALHEAKLGYLNDFQRTALINALGDQDVSAQNLTQMATNLGFQTEEQPPTQPTPPQQPGQQTGQPPQPDPAFVPPNPVDAVVEGVGDSISGLTTQEYAHIMAVRGGGDTSSFEQAVKNAKSKEELLSVISNQGKQVGLVLESDLD